MSKRSKQCLRIRMLLYHRFMTVYLCPKTSCRNLESQFDIIVQDGRNSLVDVQGFGQDAYEKMWPFYDSKSSVKVEIVRNTSYPLVGKVVLANSYCCTP